MTLTASYSPNSYTASSSQTVFPYTFKISSDSEIRVRRNGTLLSLTTHYTVSGAGDNAGGNVTLVTGATSGDTIIITRITPRTQAADFVEGGELTADTIEDAFDKLTACVQEVAYYSDDVAEAVTDAQGAEGGAVAAQIASEAAQTAAELAQAAAESAAASISLPIPVASGGTGATTDSGARTNLGLGSAATKSVGTGAGDVAAGNHTHSGVYQPADATLTSVAALSLVSGDIVYGDGADSVARLPKGADGTFLTLSSGIPAWGTGATGTVNSTSSQATTSGTYVDFTVPTDCNRIDIVLCDVSANGSYTFGIQLGDGGGIETTGYTSRCVNNDGSTQDATNTLFPVEVTGSTNGKCSGIITLIKSDSSANTWVISSILYDPNSSQVWTSAGYKSLSAAITTVRITTSTGGTLDSGLARVQYFK